VEARAAGPCLLHGPSAGVDGPFLVLDPTLASGTLSRIVGSPKLGRVASRDEVLEETRDWIEQVVVGLGLCPFAESPLRADRVRIVVSDARDAEALARDLAREIAHLDREPAERVETTVLVHPHALAHFEDFNRFLDVGDLLLERLGCVGEIQIASFHPDYCFAGASSEDVANATNRSPYPMLHLLREASVARAVAAHPDPGGIPARNAERLRALGWKGLRALRPSRPDACGR
jgi:hypothetical protein